MSTFSEHFHLLQAFPRYVSVILMSTCSARISLLSSTRVSPVPTRPLQLAMQWAPQIEHIPNYTPGLSKAGPGSQNPSFRKDIAGVSETGSSSSLLLSCPPHAIRLQALWILVPNSLPYPPSPLFVFCRGLRGGSSHLSAQLW